MLQVGILMLLLVGRSPSVDGRQYKVIARSRYIPDLSRLLISSKLFPSLVALDLINECHVLIYRVFLSRISSLLFDSRIVVFFWEGDLFSLFFGNANRMLTANVPLALHRTSRFSNYHWILVDFHSLEL